MIRQAGRKVLEGMREWPSVAADANRRIRDWRSTAGERLPGKRGEKPATAWASWWRAGIGAARRRPGLAALAAAGGVLAVAGILLYLRKRRQVAVHYTMGEVASAREGGTAHVSERAETARS